jgi:hypothetical protein
MHRLEAEVLNTLIARQDESEENPIGAAFIQDCEGPNALQKIFRRREAAGREWSRALAELRQLQFERLAFSAPPPLRAVQLPGPPPHAADAHHPENHRSPDAPSLSTARPAKIGFVFDETTPPAWRL